MVLEGEKLLISRLELYLGKKLEKMNDKTMWSNERNMLLARVENAHELLASIEYDTLFMESCLQPDKRYLVKRAAKAVGRVRTELKKINYKTWCEINSEVHHDVL